MSRSASFVEELASSLTLYVDLQEISPKLSKDCRADVEAASWMLRCLEDKKVTIQEMQRQALPRVGNGTSFKLRAAALDHDRPTSTSDDVLKTA
ncbi:hypothetical protein ASF21_10960 [Arthrobacter sp. Leaf234]|nr:hypothetical protein ASF21_10960 [Arthrobacter sp. Leaf234]